MKKILFVCEYFYPRIAGGEIWSFELLRSIAKLPNYEVTVITSRDEGQPAVTNIDNIKIYRIGKTGGMLQRVAFIRQLYNFLKKHLKANKYDIIHTMALISILPVSIACKNIDSKKVTSLHVLLGKNWYKVAGKIKGLLNFMLEDFLIRIDGSSIIHVPSEYIKKQLITKKKIVVIPNFIDVKKIQEVFANTDTLAIRKKLKIIMNEYMIVCVGGLQRVKQFNELIQVIEDWNNIKLVIVGTGEERKQIEKTIKDNKLEKNVILLGEKSREETLGIIKSADLIVNPSLTESFSYVIMEAYALGKPIVSTKVGIAEEVQKQIPDQIILIDELREINNIIPKHVDLCERFKGIRSRDYLNEFITKLYR